MNRLSATFVFAVTVLSLTSPQTLSAAIVSKRVHDGVSGSDTIVTCNSGPIGANYVAETASGVKLTDPYAVARGADKGLVHLMDQGGRRAKRYIVPRGQIRAIVSLKDDAAVLDRADLVFTDKELIVVHTATANAGIFTYSEVYHLPYRESGEVDRTALQGHPDLMQTLDLGLSFYQPPGRECRPGAGDQ
jgi:hypothetical protein